MADAVRHSHLASPSPCSHVARTHLVGVALGVHEAYVVGARRLEHGDVVAGQEADGNARQEEGVQEVLDLALALLGGLP